jgi:hypothetical protein
MIQTAKKNFLPCYCDLRHEGNLEGWFLGRKYFIQYCNAHVFNIRNQAKVALCLVVTGAFCAQALTNYFADADNIDWSSPGGWCCLFNMLVLLTCVFFCLVALEQNNKSTVKLVKKLAFVSVEVSREVELESEERLERDEQRIDGAARRKQLERVHEEHLRQQAAVGPSDDGAGAANTPVDGRRRTTNDKDEVVRQQLNYLEDLSSSLREVNLNSNDIINRHDIAQEANKLALIVSELRDQGDLRRIFGIVVDRAMMSQLFGAVLAMLYVVFKTTIDGLIISYMPPTPLSAMAAAANQNFSPLKQASDVDLVSEGSGSS